MLLLSFQGKDLEQKSKQVIRLLRAIQKDYSKIDESLGVLGRHVGNAYNSLNTVSGAFEVLGQKLAQTDILETSDEDIPKLST